MLLLFAEMLPFKNMIANALAAHIYLACGGVYHHMIREINYGSINLFSWYFCGM